MHQITTLNITYVSRLTPFIPNLIFSKVDVAAKRYELRKHEV